MVATPSPHNTVVPTERNRSLALHHANLIQQRKDVESAVLEALEELMDYPTSPTASPSTPTPHDLSSFRTLVQPFQISDYDALLEERNINGKCGYVFCPRPYAKEARSRGKVRILKGGSGDVQLVPSGEVRRWCSQECARRAMFIKVQLSEVPAWERAGGLGKLEVMNEADEEALTKKMGKLGVADNDVEMTEAMSDLALERGEERNSARQKDLLKVDIVHKSSSRRAEPPDRTKTLDASSIEGHTPRAKWVDSDDDEQDTDWDLV